ncbi:hypothetical protein FB451DRAFT_1411269 [Mycena latifolia]|nr:hypothetical protein FB451DRAFT_1411269 [Mycena latifolia]
MCLTSKLLALLALTLAASAVALPVTPVAPVASAAETVDNAYRPTRDGSWNRRSDGARAADTADGINTVSGPWEA